MQRIIVISLSLFFWVGTLQAQLPNRQYGEWQVYLNQSRGIESIVRDGLVYTITSGGMFSYEPATEEIRTFSTINGMSGVSPTTIYHHDFTGQTFLGYADGMIDFFGDPNQFNYLTDVERNTFFVDKRINTFVAEENRLYVGTNFGIVVYNLDNGLPITDISQIGSNPSRLAVTSLAIYEERVYAVLDGIGIYSASVNSPNLKDPGSWRFEDGETGLPESEVILEIGAGVGSLFALTTNTIYQKNEGNWRVYSRLDRQWEHLYVTEKTVGASRIDRISIINEENVNYTFFINGAANHVVVAGQRQFYVTTRFRGVVKFDEWDLSFVIPPGPRSNDCTRLAVGNGEVYVAPKGYDQQFNPDQNANGVFHLNTQTGLWTMLDSINKRLPYEVGTSFARAFYHPETGEAYMGSYGSGLVVLQDAALQDFYYCGNSGISIINQQCNPANSENSRVSGIDFDSYGNMWVSLDLALPPLVVRNPQGEWFQIPNFRFPAEHHITDMMVDDFNNIWMVDNDRGLLVYTENSTPDVYDDGQLISLKMGTNAGNLPSNEVFSLATDQDGFIWVGTAKGVTVFFDPFSISQGRVVDASPPVFDRTALLKNSSVTAIAVDGGNRKWLGTEDGIFLVSENGDELLAQYTEANSPLLSNRILDIEIDPKTGLVFIATDKGMMSLQGEAIEGESSCNDVLVYPNPVFTDFQGLITIKGTAAESKVKITSISGMLVKEVDSLGGIATWDGRDAYGKQVRSGIYLALIADRNGEKACVGKFSVIAR